MQLSVRIDICNNQRKSRIRFYKWQIISISDCLFKGLKSVFIIFEEGFTTGIAAAEETILRC